MERQLLTGMEIFVDVGMAICTDRQLCRWGGLRGCAEMEICQDGRLGKWSMKICVNVEMEICTDGQLCGWSMEIRMDVGKKICMDGQLCG